MFVVKAVIHFQTFERGPAYDWVVFVHGAGGSSNIWFQQVLDFRKHFNVLLVDLRGHGRSRRDSPPPEGYVLEDLCRDILEVLDHLQIQRAHFVGVSLGCALIRSLADIDAGRVATMVLGGAVTHLDRSTLFWVVLGNLGKHVLPYLWMYRFFAWIIMPGPRHRATRKLFSREARKMGRSEFKRWFALTWQARDLLRRFEEDEISTPTLYLMGQHDYLFLPSARAMVARHASSVLEVIEGAGHVCNVERPALFNARAVAFLEAHPIATPAPV